MRPCFIIFAAGLLSCAGVRAVQPSAEELKKLPPAIQESVNFKKDIQPLLETSCVKCHGKGKDKGGFNFDTREKMLKGGESGPVVIPGKSAESRLIHLVAGLDPDTIMPEKGTRLTPRQVGLLRTWIDQGMPWDSDVTFARKPVLNLSPRKPPLPAVRKTNPIDRLLAPYFQANKVRTAGRVRDELYVRRVYLDVVGLTPNADEVADFVADRADDKRARLVRRLLADNQRYAENWLTFWNDLLRNDYRGAGFIDGGRKQITSWLYSVLATNLPYNQFIAQLVNPVPESEGFTKGIVWRGVVNASQTPPMQAAQGIGQVLLGTNLKCASCHDSFISDWTLADSYGLASIYSDKPLELVQCDKPLGKLATPRFLFPELGGIDPSAPRPERLKRLAEIITSRQDGRITRTIVNRLWQRFMGRALVEPVDEMESPAWNPDLLDWLAEDLADNGYNLKHTMELILTSDAYQMPAVNVEEGSRSGYVFRGPAVRRMSAEEFLDSLGVLTGIWNRVPAADVDFTAGKSAEQLAEWLGPETRARWIWNHPDAAKSVPVQTLHFRKSVALESVPDQACIVVNADDAYKLFINGQEVPPNNDFPWFDKTSLTDIRRFLKTGTNVFAVEVKNNAASPAGVLVYARLRSIPVRGRSVVSDFVSDASWVCSSKMGGAWTTVDYAPGADWGAAVELGDYGMAPWNLKKRYEAAVATANQYGKVRAALVPASPLMVAMGRPTREQVVTTRSSVATTLQALEMTNGATLSDLLRKGAEQWKQRGKGLQPSKLVEKIYQQALGRKPTGSESSAATAILGPTPDAEQIEDVLWAVVMLPEYQLIY